jgi:hypothetical protein
MQNYRLTHTTKQNIKINIGGTGRVLKPEVGS